MKRRLITPFMTFAILGQLIHLVAVLSVGEYSRHWSLESALLAILSIAIVALFTASIELLSGKNTRRRKILHVLYFLCLGFFISYLYSADASLDYSILAANANSAFSREATTVIFQYFKLNPLLAMLVLLGVYWYMAKKRGWWATNPYADRKKRYLAMPMIYALAVLLPIEFLDEYSRFIQSTGHYYRSGNDLSRMVIPGEYPYIKEGKPAGKQFTRQNAPNIFIIAVESFNGKYIDKMAPDGREYTPVFNKLAKTGISAPNYYSNGTQTAKGQYAMYFSVLPTNRGTISHKYRALKGKSIQEILGPLGYRTVQSKASPITNFDNFQKFMQANGIDWFYSIKPYLKPQDESEMLDWGPTDKVFYKRFFESLDQDQAKHPKKPYFALLATIATHMPFEIPEEMRLYKKDAKTFEDHYLNSLMLVDAHFKVFFNELEKRDYLKNSIVIITGDHSYPMGGHGYYRQEIGYYDEMFDVPFVMIGPKHWAGREIQAPASHMDVAPTILDLLDIEHVTHHFQGQSMLGELSPTRPVTTIQHGRGGVIVVRIGNMKLMRHLKTNKEELYDVVADPEERHNLIKQISAKDRELFDSEIQNALFNQALIEFDQIWDERQ